MSVLQHFPNYQRRRLCGLIVGEDDLVGVAVSEMSRGYIYKTCHNLVSRFLYVWGYK